MIEREIELLAWSKTLMPALPVDRLHGLIVEEMGKNFSGTGADTNIIGRLRIQGEAEMTSPNIRYVSVLDLTEESHGNATGIGLVDFVTQKLIDKVDRKATYLNNLTTTFVTRAFLPTWYDTEQEAIETMPPRPRMPWKATSGRKWNLLIRKMFLTITTWRKEASARANIRKHLRR